MDAKDVRVRQNRDKSVVYWCFLSLPVLGVTKPGRERERERERERALLETFFHHSNGGSDEPETGAKTRNTLLGSESKVQVKRPPVRGSLSGTGPGPL